MNCLLCNQTIDVFDASAGCQDPAQSYSNCDRLGQPSSASDEPALPVQESTTAAESLEPVTVPLDDTGTAAVDPTEYQSTDSPPVV